MNFNDKLNRHYGNLDNAYDALMEAREKEILGNEIIRDYILKDETLFQRLAQKYLDDPVNREGFLDWSIEQVKMEREPQFRRAWKDEPSLKQRGK